MRRRSYIRNWGGVAFLWSPTRARGCGQRKAPLTIHYGELDTRVNKGWPTFEAAMKAAGTSYEVFTIPSSPTGFTTIPRRAMTQRAAELAWGRTVAFLKVSLG